MHIVLHRINGFPRMGRVGGVDSHQVKPLTLTLAPDQWAPPAPPSPRISSGFLTVSQYPFILFWLERHTMRGKCLV